MKFSLLALFAFVLVLGCTSQEAPVGAPELPPQRSFEGSADGKIIGTWKSKGGESVMALNKDGTMNFETKVNTPGGPQNVKIDGKWLCDKDALLLQDTTGTQPKVIAYTYKVVSPTELELSTSFPKSKTVYKKQS